MMNRVWMGVVWAFVLILPTGSAEAVEQLLPDLIAWESEPLGYIHGWFIDTDEIPGRILLRLSSTIANIGAGPTEIRGGDVLPDGSQEVFQRIYNDDSSFSDVLAGTFTFHPPHGHVHYDGFAQYNLREVTAGNGVGPILTDGTKTSFCLIDFTKYDPGLPGAPTVEAYDVCVSTVQGISVGWADVYNYTLADQWIDITDVSRDGDFWLEVVADPDNNLIESDETNNATRILITLGGPADFDGDGDQDPNDLDLLRMNFGDPAFDLDADLDADEDDVAYMVNVILGTVYGDANLDGTTSFADFAALQTRYNQPGGWGDGEFNGDGMVTFADFGIMQSNFGSGSAAPATVPEPATLGLLGLGGLMLTRRR